MTVHTTGDWYLVVPGVRVDTLERQLPINEKVGVGMATAVAALQD